MLTLLALALSGQLAVSSPPSPPIVSQSPIASVMNRVPEACGDGIVSVDFQPSASAGSGPSTLRFDGAQTADGRVRKYMLLDRRDQNNCPSPISYAVPDQPRALGRVIGERASKAPVRLNR